MSVTFTRVALEAGQVDSFLGFSDPTFNPFQRSLITGQIVPAVGREILRSLVRVKGHMNTLLTRNHRDQKFQAQTKPADIQHQRKVVPFFVVEISFFFGERTPFTDHFRGRKDFLPVEPQGCLSFLILLGEPRFA